METDRQNGAISTNPKLIFQLLSFWLIWFCVVLEFFFHCWLHGEHFLQLQSAFVVVSCSMVLSQIHALKTFASQRRMILVALSKCKKLNAKSYCAIKLLSFHLHRLNFKGHVCPGTNTWLYTHKQTFVNAASAIWMISNMDEIIYTFKRLLFCSLIPCVIYLFYIFIWLLVYFYDWFKLHWHHLHKD